MKKFIMTVLIVCISVVLILVSIHVWVNNRVVLATENFKINQKILNYYIELEKDNYVNNYTQKYGDYYLDAAGLDPKKSLKKQESCYGRTWYEYFREKTVEDLKIKLLYCEAATKQGFVVSSDELEKAKENNKELFGNISGSALKHISKLELLVNIYLENFNESINITEKEKVEYYQNNRELFDCVDYDCITIKYQYSEENIENKLADEIIESINSIGFEETVSKLKLNENPLIEIKSEIEYRYDKTTQFGSWAFESERKTGDVIGFDGRGVYSIYHIKKSAYPINYNVRKIQKISLKNIGEKDRLNQLNEIKSKLEENNTQENLYSQAERLNLDVVEIKAKKEDLSLNLEDWVYDTSRKIGDFAILEDELMTTFVRYCGESESYYEIHMVDCLYESILNDNLNELKDSISIIERIK